MKAIELRDLLAKYPDDTEVLILRPECEDYEEFYDPDFCVEPVGDSKLVID